MTCERWQVDDLTVDFGSQSVSRGGVAIDLPQLSFRFLLALIHEAPNLVTIDQLMEQVWAGVFVNNETVKQRAKLLRDALGDDPKAPRYFAVRRGVGYQLLSEPHRLDRTTQPARGRSRWRSAAAAAALGLAGLGAASAVALWPGSQPTSPVASARVAVLPFDNLSSNPADDFIARSIPEMVLNRLSSVQGLAVISRESSMLSMAARAAPV